MFCPYFLSILSGVNDLLLRDGGQMKLLGMGAVLLIGQTQTLSLKGKWLPKQVPSTDQANINMTGNRAVFL